MMDQGHSSEVAHLLKQIEAEYTATQYGIYGYAECARHAFITARMERMGRLHDALRGLVGDGAIRLLAERLEMLPPAQEMGGRQ